MISANGKANIKQELKDLTLFSRSTLKTLNTM